MLHKNAIAPVLFIGGALLFVMMLLVGLQSDGSYTFFSKAQEEKESITISELSIEPQSAPVDMIGSCVQDLTYLPQADVQQTCFVQIKCAGNVKSETVASVGCTEVDGLITCDGSCESVKAWSDTSAAICGCSL